MQRSRFGVYMRFVGANPHMALAAGIPVAMTIFLAVGLSGALSGAAGFVMGAAQEHRLTGTMAAGLRLFRDHDRLPSPATIRSPVLVVAFMIGGLYAAGQSVKVFLQPAAGAGLADPGDRGDVRRGVRLPWCATGCTGLRGDGR